MTNPKKIVISSLIIAILIMSIGYSALASELQVTGVAQITGDWDVRITNIEVQKKSCTNCDAGTPTYTKNTVSFNAKLHKPGDQITYSITIANEGNIDAKLNRTVFDLDPNIGSPAILYAITPPSDELKPGESTNFIVNIFYDSTATEIPEEKTKPINGIIEYVQK